MTGTVITFYSYKGGVGRSFALANCASVLAEWGFKVLVVDWDIEAPGLDYYFSEFSSGAHRGVIDFIHDCATRTDRHWSVYCEPVDLPGIRGSLYLMPAMGKVEAFDYAAALQALNWDELYDQFGFGTRVESLRSSWVDEFDFVFVDSRTGITDFSGVTTAQLPDILCFLFTANRQSLQGCCDVVMRSIEARRRLPLDRPALLPVPIPSKFEMREEYDRAQFWRKEFVRILGPMIGSWVPPSLDSQKIFDLLSIPYVPRWTFGEELSVLQERADGSNLRSPNYPVSFTIETIAALLAQKLGRLDLLHSSRDEYVRAAQLLAGEPLIGRQDTLKVFLSYNTADAHIAGEIASELKNMGIVVVQASDINQSAEWATATSSLIEEVDALIAIISNDEARTQDLEIENFLRARLRSGRRKVFIPVVLPGAKARFSHSRYGDFKSVPYRARGHLRNGIRKSIMDNFPDIELQELQSVENIIRLGMQKKKMKYLIQPQSASTGRVKWYNAQKGYGFITPDDGGKDIFFHATGLSELKQGQAVSFELNEKAEHPGASGIKPIRQR